MEILEANLEELNYIGIHSDNFVLPQKEKKLLTLNLNNLKELVPAYSSILLNITQENNIYHASLCVNSYSIQLYASGKDTSIGGTYKNLEEEILKQVNQWKQNRKIDPQA